MKYKVYRNWRDLPQNSDALFTNSEKESLFLSQEWFEAVTKHITNTEQELLLACVIKCTDTDVVESEESVNKNTGINSNKKRNEKLLAVLPILTNTNKEWTSLCHRYSSLYSVICVDDQQQEVLHCLCKGLKELPFEYLTLAPIADNDEKLTKLQQGMEISGIECNRNYHSYNWYHKTHGQSFAEYMSDRPSKIRNTIVRKQRKLERDCGYKIELHSCSESDNSNDMKQALSDYHGIYKKSWKANEQHESLVKNITHDFTKHCWTRLAILSVNGEPIAAHLWFVVAGKANIFRLVYDQTWKQYSPGSILMSYLLEYVIDIDKVDEIDFLSGNDAYKKDWMSERRKRVSLVCVKKEKESIKQPKGLLDRFFKFLRR